MIYNWRVIGLNAAPDPDGRASVERLEKIFTLNQSTPRDFAGWFASIPVDGIRYWMITAAES